MGPSPLFKLLVHFCDQAQDLLSPHFFYGAGDEMLWQELPGFPHLLQERLYVCADDALTFLIGFCKDEGEGDLPFSQPVYEFEVDLLRGMAAVDEYENVDEVLSFSQIVFDHLFPFLPLSLRHFGKAIARQVDDIPLIVDVKVIDQLGFAGRAGGFGKLFVIGDHIDQGRLADIASPDEGVLRPVGLRTFRMVGTADDVDGGVNVHTLLNE